MDDVDISAPETEDADAIADCWVGLAAGQREYDSHILPEKNRGRITDAIVRHVVAETILVAESTAGALLGFVMFTLEGGTYEQDVRRGIIENLYVVPEARNRGIGTALLEAAETQLRERGVDVVALEAMAPNEDARRFYRERGYDPHRVEFEKRVESDTHSKGDQ